MWAKQDPKLHYTQPNFSSILPDYINAEAEDIKAAFTIGNHVSLRELPDKIAYTTVLKAKGDKAKENLRAGIQQST
jgi:hypothetical protein